MSSKVQASLAAVEAAASEQRRYFHVHKPDAPVTTVPWRDAWVHHENTRTHNGLHVAHCIVGQPRSIVAPEMRAMLRRHLFERFPGKPWVFVHFSTPSLKNGKSYSSPRREDLVRAAKDLGAVSINISDTIATTVPDCHARKASLPATDPASVRLKHIIMWSNVRHCFVRQVVPFEREELHEAQFDFVTRIRTDAVHIAPLVLPPLGVMRQHVLLPFRGVDAYGILPNDHMAIVPRAQAPQYFERIAERFNDCSEQGIRFHDAWHIPASNDAHTKGSTRIRLLEESAAFRLAHMGRGYVEMPWPYALSARKCCCDPSCSASGAKASCAAWYGREAGTEAGHTGHHAAPIDCLARKAVPQSCDSDCPLSGSIESVAEACVLPLQCTRLSTRTNKFGLRALPPNSSMPTALERLFQACANVSQWPDRMQGPCASMTNPQAWLVPSSELVIGG